MNQNASKKLYFKKQFYSIFLIIRRNCNTESGSLQCWKETTDGFSYGLSTAMIDFCQVILKIRNLTSEQVCLISSNKTYFGYFVFFCSKGFLV